MTTEEIPACKECQTFDCKSIQIEPKALAIPIVAMVNVDGGVPGIGVSDKTRRIEGVDGNKERPNKLLRVPFSFCNPKIAQYLKAYKYVKEFGEGIDRICNELETKGCAISSFHIDAFILKATLMAVWTTEKEFDRPSTAQDNGMANAQVSNTELTDRQRRIYEIIKNGTVSGMVNDTVNAQNLSVVLGISLRTTKRDLYVLRDMHLIQFVGSDKTGHWEVIQ